MKKLYQFIAHATPSPPGEGMPAPARIAGGRTACPNWDRRAKQAGGEVKNLLLILLVLTSSLFTSHAQFKDLFDFNNSNGRQPYGDLAISGGQMFGMTEVGATFAGNIFSIDTNGANFKNLLEFNGTNGGSPNGSLTLVGNKLFGMSQVGGTYFDGVVFSIDTNGANYKIILNFNGTNGGYPLFSNLTISGKKLFGMTEDGGAVYDSGVVFTVDTNGANSKTLHNFSGTDGSRPVGSLTLSGGQLFGMTTYDGADTDGVIFSIDTNGNNYKILHNFDLKDASPVGSLTLIGSVLYGVSTGDTGVIFRIDSNGSNYKPLFYFNGTDGFFPVGSLTLSGKTLYGMTEGSTFNSGNIFSIDTNGNNFIDLFDFNGTNGCGPNGSVTIAGNSLYGMTITGGVGDCNTGDGVIFKFNAPGLGVNELKTKNEELRVFPNPNNGVFALTLPSPNGEGAAFVEIYTMFGQKIYSSIFNIQHSIFNIHLTNQPSGVYIIKVSSANQSFYNKLIINN